MPGKGGSPNIIWHFRPYRRIWRLWHAKAFAAKIGLKWPHISKNKGETDERQGNTGPGVLANPILGRRRKNIAPNSSFFFRIFIGKQAALRYKF